MKIELNDMTTTADLARLAEENSALIENSLDLIALIDADGRFLRLNAATFDILGYRPEELVGRRYDELLDDQERAWFQALRSELRSGVSTRRDIEHRWMRKDGRPIIMSSSVRWCALNQVTYATARDVTGQHAARAALDKSQLQLQVMLESIGDAFFAVDREWRVTFANRKAGNFVNVDVGLAIGKNLLDVAPDLRDSPALDYYRRAMETGVACSFETFWEPSGTWVEARAYPSDDGLSVYFHDITFKYQAEQALKKSEQRFRNLFQQAADSIIIADRNQFIVAANGRACSNFGYTEDEFLRLRVPDIDSGHAYSPELAGALADGQTQLLRIEKRRKDGSTFPADVHISRFEDNGQPFFQAIIRDVTEREETQNRLRELATHDTLTGLPNRALLGERVQHLFDACPHDRDGGGDVPRPRPLQGSQRFLRPRARRRPAVRSGGAPAPGDAAGRHRRAPGRRRVRDRGRTARRRKSAAARIAEKLLDVLAAPVTIDGHDVIIGASIGISLFPADGRPREQLFQNADTAMYRAKAAGRNRYRFFEPEMTLRRARAHGARDRAAPGAGARRVRAALPAAHRPAQHGHGRHGSADPLEPSRARPGLAGAIHRRSPRRRA